MIMLSAKAMNFTLILLLMLDIKFALAQKECIKVSDPNGWEYRGTLSKTETGLQCQRWDSDAPHKPNYRPENPSEHENYCRTTEDSDGPWCYTTDPNKRWEKCDVAKCSECLQESDLTGRNYNGTESHTRSGRLCQRWDVNSPHEPHFWPDKDSLHTNYCRNPDGEDLPWCYTTDPSKRWEFCSVRKCSEPKKPQACVLCKGAYYKGTLNTTTSGRTCQRWDTGFPHSQYYPFAYPSIRNAENYCRNPDSEDGLWCYTTDPNSRWEYCDLPTCLNEDGSLKLPTDVEYTAKCYSENGESYRGDVAVTYSGNKCLKWSNQLLHGTEFTPEKYPCSGLEGNSCRNPFFSARHKPWCFTADSDQSWEYCDIPRCGSSKVDPIEPPTAYSQKANIAGVLSIFPPDPEGCYSCNGFQYRGTANITVSGKTCQRWDSDKPHKPKNYLNGPDMRENYCRSADNEPKPWCYTTDPNTRWEYCVIDRCTNDDGSLYIPEVKHTTKCAFRRGQTYRGNVSKTATGRSCARWGSNVPQQQHYTPEKFPCSGLDENYCRKPDFYFNFGAPWCYTTDPKRLWEYCNIPFCGNDGKVLQVESQLSAQCGVQAFKPVFTKQPYDIIDGKIVKTAENSVRHMARIIGGEVVAHGTWPWLISLLGRRGGHYGGAMLIHESWVLTAAHCLGSSKPGDYLMFAGRHKGLLDSRSQGRVAKRHFTHEEYIYGSPNDIALIQVDEPFTITEFVRPVCLPEPDAIIPDGEYCVAAGWGRTDDPNHPGGLKQVVLQTYDCNSEYYVCTGKFGDDIMPNICYGDSGGPLVKLENGKWVAYGIASYGYGCSIKDGRAGWTRVSKYMGWINRRIKTYQE